LFIVLVLLIFEMTSIIQSLATSFGLSLPPEATQMAQAVAQQPLQGTQTTAVGSYGSVALSWGLGLGAYMLLAAAIVRLVAAIVLRGVKEAKPRTAATQTPPPPPL
jgi:Na+-transporting methylmalonyl-CoA/oxaloacetate decarboxylase gamma subunit